jgi:hypothetical protein
MKYRTLIFAHATEGYYPFVLPYLFFVLTTNEDVVVEVTVEDASVFASRFSAGLDHLRRVFPCRQFVVRQTKISGVRPNSVRFIEEPDLVADNIYIGDVDIMILDPNLTIVHEHHMTETHLPYSNMQREGQDKLTGLHFSRMDSYYPLADISDLDLQSLNDEELLFQLVRRKGLPIVGGSFRPVHGVHISPNRPLAATADMPGWELPAPYLRTLETLTDTFPFIGLEPYLDRRFKFELDRVVTHMRIHLPNEAKRAMQSTFTSIMKKNLWLSQESVSGTGSTWRRTAQLRWRLRTLFADLGIRRLLDVPCGDLNWLIDIVDELELYIGADIVEELVVRHTLNNANRNMLFKLIDVTRDPLPEVDAILCRDCLVHLPFSMATKALARMGCSGAKHLMLTTFPGHDSNEDIRSPGPWRPLDLTKAPFCLPEPRILIQESDDPRDPYRHKSLGVWEGSLVASAILRSCL